MLGAASFQKEKEKKTDPSLLKRLKRRRAQAEMPDRRLFVSMKKQKGPGRCGEGQKQPVVDIQLEVKRGRKGRNGVLEELHRLLLLVSDGFQPVVSLFKS